MRILKNDFVKYPKYKSLFAASLGSGTHLFTLGALFTALVVIYALTSGIAGYIAASSYCQLEGTNWECAYFCSLLGFGFLSDPNCSSIWHNSGDSSYMTSWYFTFVGVGWNSRENYKAEFQAPCRTTKYPREIPPLPRYPGAIPQMAMAGFLPFSAYLH
ncbi:hypothetical protein Pint_16845 [Pistacia integerrima]|uniref:Uncharacterized protein n=1 Tax=Pistacia integerrima TaxID=434235 RepID=A0ACC0ZG15_9ROSI|nr:hypothetical protein Pint_16845 [Pistacia integerrima]